MKVINEYFERLCEHGLYPTRYRVLKKNGIKYKILDEDTDQMLEVDNFCSNDVLGLAQLDEVRNAAKTAIDRFGASNSSCTFYCGRVSLHADLEESISSFKKIPHTHLFLNAWMAVQALTDTYCHLAMKLPDYSPKTRTLIMVDHMSHSCITSAATSAKLGISGQLFPRKDMVVEVKPYRHCDAENLALRLKKYASKGDRIMVMTDSVFSMEGTIAPLPEIIEVLSNYEGAVLVCDEAHSSGVIGKRGGGIYDHFTIDPNHVHERGIEPVTLTTFSKFAGSVGAAISSFNKSFTLLLDAARTSSGTASLSAPLAAAALASLQYLEQHPELVATLRWNANYLRTGLNNEGFEVEGETAILPVKIGGIPPQDFARKLLYEHGVWVSPVWYVDKPKLRIMASVLHTEQDMDTLVESLVMVRQKLA
ncbi:MAG: aminotransferase class I/II-fold pyridoxal phosphate-dependent enzyme [Proteobacteria bacterium]|nr:aminotransferase class I/II-fold pyridoxal phosphate-dependent enzyme [Pseudomonadota bacterium]